METENVNRQLELDIQDKNGYTGDFSLKSLTKVLYITRSDK